MRLIDTVSNVVDIVKHEHGHGRGYNRNRKRNNIGEQSPLTELYLITEVCNLSFLQVSNFQTFNSNDLTTYIILYNSDSHIEVWKTSLQRPSLTV